MKLTQSPPSPMSKFAVDRPMVALLAVWLACNIFTPVKDAHIENPNCHLLTTSPSLRGAEGPPELRSRSSASLIVLPGPPRADPASCLEIHQKFRHRILSGNSTKPSYYLKWQSCTLWPSYFISPGKRWVRRVDDERTIINSIITQLSPMHWKWVCQNPGIYLTAIWRPW